MKRLALALLMLTACGGGSTAVESPPAPHATTAPEQSPSPELFTMHGTVDGVSCLRSDARAQMVKVTDEDGTLIGQGRTSRSTSGGCQVFQTFIIIDLPQAKFYTVQLGERDGPTYSFGELERAEWNVKLKYGF